MGLLDTISTKALELLNAPRFLIFANQLDWLYRVLYNWMARDFVTIDDLIAYVSELELLVNTHIHASPAGPTLMPEPPMILPPFAPVLAETKLIPASASGVLPIPFEYPVRRPMEIPVIVIPGLDMVSGDAIQPFSI